MMSFRLPVLLLLSAVSVCRAVCPSGWDDHDGKCYRYINAPNFWTVGVATCDGEEAGATLASVHDDDLNTYLLGVTGNEPAWLGLRGDTTTGVWAWADGSIYDYVNWASGEPAGDGELCAQLCDDASGDWCSDLCNEHGKPLGYVCQLDG